jgi:hypothetical protein
LSLLRVGASALTGRFDRVGNSKEARSAGSVCRGLSRPLVGAGLLAVECDPFADGAGASGPLDGTRGRLRIDYGDPREPREAIAWLWKFLDGAKTAGELYGRALVIIAAEQYASRLVLTASQRGHRSQWSSRKDTAAKALRKLAGPQLPASLSALERAVKRAHAAHDEVEQAQRREARENAAADIEPTPPVEPTDADGEDVDRQAA